MLAEKTRIEAEAERDSAEKKSLATKMLAEAATAEQAQTPNPRTIVFPRSLINFSDPTKPS